MRFVLTTALAIVLSVGRAGEASAASCESLASLSLPDTTITMAQIVAPGAFAALAVRGGRVPGPFAKLPSFCRIAATLKPTSDSDIKVEVWLPTNGWNGKFQAVGNAGWAGTISYPAMAAALQRGYATTSTDTGPVGGWGVFARPEPPKGIALRCRPREQRAGESEAARRAL